MPSLAPTTRWALRWPPGADEVFRQLVLARIIEPTSKEDSVRVLEETGLAAVSYPTIKRHLPGYAEESWRGALATACAARAALGPASLVLYDVTTLYFETNQGDTFREPGFSKERCLEPQMRPRAAHRRDRVPVDGRGVRGQQGRVRHEVACVEWITM